MYKVNTKHKINFAVCYKVYKKRQKLIFCLDLGSFPKTFHYAYANIKKNIF